jgi:small nuclear ribonucleoprotein
MQEEAVVKELEQSKGKALLLKLIGERTIRGKLEEVDKHMNVTLIDAEEILDDSQPLRLGTILVRGESIVVISLS